MVSRRRTGERRPFSMRLADAGLRALQEEAERYRVAPRTLAQELLEEGLRMRRIPGIAFADRGGRRCAVVARRPRLRVAQVIDVALDSASLVEAADHLDLTLREVEQTVDYYRAYRAEIDGEREQDRVESERAERAWRERESILRR